MAIIFAESFDHYGSGKSTTVKNRMLAGLWAEIQTDGGMIGSGEARTGLYCFEALGPGSAGILDTRRVLPSPKTDMGLALAIKFPDGLPSLVRRNGFQFRSAGGSVLLSVLVSTDGSITVLDGDYNDVVLGTASKKLIANSWQHLECHVVMSTTIGEVELRLNEVPVLHLTGLNLGSTAISQIVFPSEGDNTVVTYIDDMVAWDATGATANDFLGRVRVLTVYPDADGAVNDWLSTGANAYTEVDEVTPDNDTTYISAANPDDEVELELPTLPSDVDVIEGVFIPVLARQETAGSTDMEVSLISGAGETVGASVPIADTYTYYGTAFSEDPENPGVKLSKSVFEAAKFKIKRTV